MTLCQLFENPVFCLLYLILYKDQQFIIYIEKYGRSKIKEEIDKLISSPRLRKQTIDVFLESFKSFLYKEVNRKHQRYTLFTRSWICIYVDSSKTIIKNLNLIDLHSILLLRNNITKLLLLKDWITSQYNRVLIAVVALEMLYYTWSEHSNIMQRVNIQFTFANNVLNWFVKLFHQIDLFVSYKSLRHKL